MAPATPGWSRAKRPEARGRTRQAIVETALRLFAERGYIGVRVEDIAREAGVSRATFYKHFAERDEILAELFGQLLHDDHDALTMPVRGGIETRVGALLEATAEAMAEDELLARFVYSLPIRHDAVLPGASAAPRVFDRISDELEAAAAAGEVRTDVPVERVLELLGRVFETAMRDWAGGLVDDPSTRLAELVGIVFRGVAVAPRRRPRAGTTR